MTPSKAEEPLELLNKVVDAIEGADRTAEAADGPVLHVRDVLTDEDWRVMYRRLVKARDALRERRERVDPDLFLASPLNCDHETGWLERPLDDTTWCAGCGRWRDDIMRERGYPPGEQVDPDLRARIEALRRFEATLIDRGWNLALDRALAILARQPDEPRPTDYAGITNWPTPGDNERPPLAAHPTEPSEPDREAVADALMRTIDGRTTLADIRDALGAAFEAGRRATLRPR